MVSGNVKLKDVMVIDRKNISPENIKSGTTYIGLEHINSDGTFNLLTKVENGDLSSNKFIFSPDHILYGKLRPYLKKIACPTFIGICSTDILPLKVQPNLNKKYLYYYLRQQHIIDLATEKCAGANLPRINPSELLNFEIPLPPLDVQKKIATVLDKADNLRRKRREALEKLDQLVQSVFLDMFGDPISNPKGWEVNLLRELITEFRYGSSTKSTNDGYPILRIPNIISDDITLEDLKHVQLPENEFKLLRLEYGDILFVRTNGNRHFVGRCAVFDLEGTYVYASYLIRAKLIKEKLNPHFLVNLLKINSAREMVMEKARTSAGQYNINTKGLGDLKIITPPKHLQDDFAKKIEVIKKNKIKIYKSEAKLETLFNSLLQRAFRGELKFNDSAFSDMEEAVS